MCGIGGYITKKDYTLNNHQKGMRKKILRGLLVANQERGDQSTGVAIVDKNNETLIAKEAKPAIEFVYRCDFNELLTLDHYIAIGHTRQATVGAVNQENAHPFNKKDITGVHNGCVYNWREINSNADVDSEVIFELLNKHHNNYGVALPKLSGLFAVVWHYNGNDGIYLTRSGNPLTVSYVEKLKTYFFSSEERDIKTVLASHLGDEFNLWDPVSDHVYRIDGRLKITKKEAKFSDERSWDYNKGKKKEKGKKNVYPQEQSSSLGKTYLLGDKNKEAVSGTILPKMQEEAKEETSDLDKELANWVYRRAIEGGCDECKRLIQFVCYYSETEDLIACLSCFQHMIKRDDKADYSKYDLLTNVTLGKTIRFSSF